jgi:hypothetical protein
MRVPWFFHTEQVQLNEKRRFPMVHCKSRMKLWIVAAVAVCLMLGVAPGQSLAQ